MILFEAQLHKNKRYILHKAYRLFCRSFKGWGFHPIIKNLSWQLLKLALFSAKGAQLITIHTTFQLRPTFHANVVANKVSKLLIVVGIGHMYGAQDAWL